VNSRHSFLFKSKYAAAALWLAAAAFTCPAKDGITNNAALWRPRLATPAIVALDSAADRQFVAEIRASSSAKSWSASIANDLRSWPCEIVSAAYSKINNASEPGWRVKVSVPADAPPELFTLTVACNEFVSVQPQSVGVIEDFETNFYVLHITDEQIVNQYHTDPSGQYYKMVGTWEEMKWMQQPVNLINPRFVIVTGDQIDFNGALDGWNNWANWGYAPHGKKIFTKQETLDLEYRLSAMYKDCHKGYHVPYVETPGNHDVTPPGKRLKGSDIDWHPISARIYEEQFGQRDWSFRMGDFYVLMHDWSSARLKQWAAKDYAAALDDPSIKFRLIGQHFYKKSDAKEPFVPAKCDLMLVGHGHTTVNVQAEPYPIYEDRAAFKYGTAGFFNFRRTGDDWSCDQTAAPRDKTNDVWGLFTDNGITKKVRADQPDTRNITTNSVTIINDLPHDFYDGRVRFVLPKGNYPIVKNGIVLAEYDSADGSKTAVLVKVNIPAKGSIKVSVPKPVELPGKRADGSVLLPNQWSLRPAGRQVPMGDFPVNIAVHPGGRFAAVLHSGFGKHEIRVVDVKDSKVVSHVEVGESFYGLTFSHDGKHLYCSGAGQEVVHVFDFHDGQLTAKPDIRLREEQRRGIPAGLAITKNGKWLFVANVWGQTVSEVDLPARANVAEIAFTPDVTNSAASFTNQGPVNFDLAAITKRAKATLDPTKPDAPFPYACCLDERHGRLYVSLWAQSCVAVVDLKSLKVVADWPTGEHPNEMALTKSGRYLFVANANQNTVTVLDTSTGKTVETLDASLSPGEPPGSMPNSLALSPDETKLFVANACNNNIAVFDVSTIGKSHSLGFIPVGWFPTSVRVTPDGRELLVANGKGLISRADPLGPEPGKKNFRSTESIKTVLAGTLSIVDLGRGKQFTARLAAYTKQAFACVPRPNMTRAADNPIPAQPGQPSPIKYCIYIIKENRTYDQVLGDMKEGNGDPDICLFPEKVTPNLHKIARDFVLLDNFYVDAEVSADGHEWSMGAIATDFVEKTWPLNYGHNRNGKYPYPSEGIFPIAFPANGYLWDRAREAGVSYRSYGEFVQSGKTPSDPGYARVAALKDHFDPWYRGFDIGYPDVKRAERFISELKRFENEGEMPRLQIVRMPNDHTAGTLKGRLTPTALAADNDQGVGMLVDAVSHSKFWPRTAIFILEDDAQDGPDHVDAHRSPAYIVSPYTRRHAVDSTMYSTSSMLHTMELILGLQPMTQYDAAAQPMYNAFQAEADLQPFETAPPQVDLHQRNTPQSWGSAASGKMDFSKEDATDEQALNEIIWHSVRGADQPMPAPVHAAFVFSHPKDDDDD